MPFRSLSHAGLTLRERAATDPLDNDPNLGLTIYHPTGNIAYKLSRFGWAKGILTLTAAARAEIWRSARKVTLSGTPRIAVVIVGYKYLI